MVALVASDSEPALARRLCDILEEQQEPFVLDVASRTRDYGNNRRRWWSLPLLIKTQGMNRRMMSHSTICSRALKCILDTFALPCKAHGTEILQIRGRQDVSERCAGRECDGSSSSRISRYCDSLCSGDMANHSCVSSCSDSLKALNLSDAEDIEVMEDSKRLSPASVLEIPANETSPVNFRVQCQSHINLMLLSGVADDSIFFCSMWETLVQTVKEKQGFDDAKLQEVFGFVSSSQYFKRKKLVHQTRHLLFDYVKEVVTSYARTRRTSIWTCASCMFRQHLGPQQLVKSTCEQISSWRRRADDMTEDTKLLEADISRNEFSHLSKHEMYAVVRKIEAAILSGIIDEITSDLLRQPT